MALDDRERVLNDTEQLLEEERERWQIESDEAVHQAISEEQERLGSLYTEERNHESSKNDDLERRMKAKNKECGSLRNTLDTMGKYVEECTMNLERAKHQANESQALSEERLVAQQLAAMESEETSEQMAAVYKIQASVRKRSAKKDKEIIAREMRRELRQLEERLAAEQRSAKELKESFDKTAAAYKIQTSMRKRAAKNDRLIIARDLRRQLDGYRTDLLREREQRLSAEHDAEESHHLADAQEKQLEQRLSQLLEGEQRSVKKLKEFSDMTAAAYKIQTSMRKRAAKNDRLIIARDLRRQLDGYRTDLLREREQRLSAEHDAEESHHLADAQEKQLEQRLSQLLEEEQRSAKELEEFSDETAAAYKIQTSMRKRAAKKDRLIIARDLRQRLEICRAQLLEERERRVAAEHDAASAHHETAESQAAAFVRLSKSEASSEKLVAAYKIQASVRKRSAYKDKKSIARDMRRRLKEDHLSLLGKISRLTQDKDDTEQALELNKSKLVQYLKDAKKWEKEKEQMLQELKDKSAALAAKQRNSGATSAIGIVGSKNSIHNDAAAAVMSKEAGAVLAHQDRLKRGLAMGVALTFCLAFLCSVVARRAFVLEQCTMECAGADMPYGV